MSRSLSLAAFYSVCLFESCSCSVQLWTVSCPTAVRRVNKWERASITLPWSGHSRASVIHHSRGVERPESLGHFQSVTPKFTALTHRRESRESSRVFVSKRNKQCLNPTKKWWLCVCMSHLWVILSRIFSACHFCYLCSVSLLRDMLCVNLSFSANIFCFFCRPVCSVRNSIKNFLELCTRQFFMGTAVWVWIFSFLFF